MICSTGLNATTFTRDVLQAIKTEVRYEYATVWMKNYGNKKQLESLLLSHSLNTFPHSKWHEHWFENHFASPFMTAEADPDI